ncbi:MAG: hypothetical protein A2V74_12330 [Acidobacteria bacterium RBG_16_70_10]|nr:MAG: hypothetical protein A2V74_12330 [Acidobacteria bacterium RBG_16_70_10]
MAPDEKQGRRSLDDRIEWVTVRYRTIAIVGGVLVVLALAAWLLLGRRPGSPPVALSTVEASAKFLSIEGSVQVKRAGTLEWRGATKEMALGRNDLVRTGSSGTAEVRLFDGTVFNVRPDCLMTIEESLQNPASQQGRWALMIQSGEANFQTTARNTPGGSNTISTPRVRTNPEPGTTGNIQVTESGDTVRIFSGSSRAETRNGQRIELGANEGVRVDAAGAAGPKMALPAAPVLTAPPHQAAVAYPDPTRAITLLVWKEVPGAASYHVLVDFSPTFARPLIDRQGHRTSQMELRGLEVGSYYWRVSALDRTGGEGDFSELWRFALARAAPSAGAPPPLTVETVELRGNLLHVRGRTEPGASLTLDGQRIDVQPDGTFNEFLTFETGARMVVVLRSMGVNGGVTEQRRPVVVSN